MAKKMVFIDTSICTGCKACTVACKAWNDLEAEKTQLITSYQSQADTTPNTWTYISMHEKYENGKMDWLMFKHQCYHCEEPACMVTCPVQAIYKTELGYTLVDHEKCIGCGYCTVSCPWGVPKVNPDLKKAMKCTGCIDRIKNGMAPACVSTCQPGALHFGDREDMVQLAKTRLEEVKKDYPKAQLYGDTIMGSTTYLYLLLEDPEFYGVPKEPAMASSLGIWKDWVQPYGIWLIPLAAAASVGSFFSTRIINNLNKTKGGKTDGA